MSDSSEFQKGTIGLASATSLGLGIMVGAGIFALVGVAGSIAGGGLYIAFLIGGAMSLLTGYSFARLGVRYPSAGGVNEYILRAWGTGTFSGTLILFWCFGLVTGLAMNAKAFGHYAAILFVGSDSTFWVAFFTTSVVLVFSLVTFIGSSTVGFVETVIVVIKISILALFAIGGLLVLEPQNLSPSTYAPVGDIFFAVALAFFSITGYSVINTAVEEMEDPAKTLPRAIFLAIILATTLYIAISFAVFGNLSVAEVQADRETTVAEAARPVLGSAGFAIIAITAILATASGILSDVFQALNTTFALAREGELPHAFERQVWKHGTEGLLVTVVLVLIVANFLDLGGIIALVVFVGLFIQLAVHAGHLRLIHETGTRRLLILLATLSLVTISILFTISVIETDPVSLIIVAVVLLVTMLIEFGLRHIGGRTFSPGRGRR